MPLGVQERRGGERRAERPKRCSMFHVRNEELSKEREVREGKRALCPMLSSACFIKRLQ